MKKYFISALLIIASAISYAVYVSHSGKSGIVPSISENQNIPYFIDTMMKHEKYRVERLFLDSNSSKMRLAKLGFSVKAGTQFDKISLRMLWTLYQCYDTIYPKHQFITFRCLNSLLIKYNLKFGTVQSYKGSVPENRIDSMESFYPSYLFYRLDEDESHSEAFNKLEDIASWGEGYGNINNYFQRTYNKITICKGALGTESDLVKYSKLDMKKRIAANPQYFIVAPSTSFDGEESESGMYGSFATKDPIVLFPVDGGYIIVTAW